MRWRLESIYMYVRYSVLTLHPLLMITVLREKDLSYRYSHNRLQKSIAYYCIPFRHSFRLFPHSAHPLYLSFALTIKLTPLRLKIPEVTKLKSRVGEQLTIEILIAFSLRLKLIFFSEVFFFFFLTYNCVMMTSK